MRIAAVEHIDLVRQMARAHAYWRLKGLSVDLVVWNEDPSGYRQVLQDEILAVVTSVTEAGSMDKPGGVFVRRSEQITEEDRVLIQTVARVIVSDTAGTLVEQMDRRGRADPMAPLLPAKDPRDHPPLQRAPVTTAPIERSDLAAFNGTGGFTPDGREYTTTPGKMFGDCTLACRLTTLVDSALAGSHADESFFSAPVSLPASGPATTTMISQKTSTSHLVRRPPGTRRSARALLMKIPQDHQLLAVAVRRHVLITG